MPYLRGWWPSYCVPIRTICGICDDMFYWASAGRYATEVDFILIRGTDRVAIEVKSGNTFTDSWCKGLRVLAPLEGLKRRMVVFPNGPTMKTKDGIEVLSFQTLPLCCPLMLCGGDNRRGMRQSRIAIYHSLLTRYARRI